MKKIQLINYIKGDPNHFLTEHRKMSVYLARY